MDLPEGHVKLDPIRKMSTPAYPARFPRELGLRARFRHVGITAAATALLGFSGCGPTVRPAGNMIEPHPMGEIDSDGDRIVDGLDSCPHDPEDEDGFEDSDGCYDSDNDADGHVDTADLCPDDAEDNDGFQDNDGCPEPDNDLDRIADADDQCPNDPEVYNGTDDNDGCPDEGQVVIRTAGVTMQLEFVYFSQGSTAIQEPSRPILDAIADTINANPGIGLVEVRGHSDGRGSDQQNLSTSQARATAALRYLILHGVDPQRLRAVGCGARCPISPLDTPEGRERNRRVDFHILRLSEDHEPRPTPCTVCVPVPVNP